MKVSSLELEGLKLIELQKYPDQRGFFTVRYSEDELRRQGFNERFVQDNHSRSLPGVLRGMHLRVDPPQSKLVGVVRGCILDVVVDLRRDSRTYKKWLAVELSCENGRMLHVPYGFAHGFQVLGSEPADVFYKVSAPYNPKGERGIIWNDPEIGIEWPIASPIVSERDAVLPRLSEAGLTL